MDILIKNISTLIQDADHILNDKDILIEDNKIKKIGNILPEDLPSHCKIIEGDRKVVMPGLINAHTHLYQSMLRGCRDDLTLTPWCEKVIFPFIDIVYKDCKKYNAAIGYYWSMLSSIEMIHNGITCCIDMDLNVGGIPKAWQDIGMRGITAFTIANRWVPKEFCHDNNILKEEIEQYIKEWQQDYSDEGLVQVFLAPSTLFCCTPELMEWVVEKTEEYNLGLQIHISETKWENQDALKEFGTTPLEFLEKINLLRRPISAAHCIYLTDKEIDIAARRGVILVYNPKSNMKLSDGIAPIAKMLKKGVTVALGTDGPASNDQLDMFEEMRMGSLLQKVFSEEPGVLSASEIFKMATENGAKAARINAGTIEEGKLADLIILNLNKAHSAPVNKVIQNIVYCGKNTNVETVMINGKVIMEDGKILTVDEEGLTRESIKQGEEILKRIDFNKP
ncbi:MAG TPA: amidohydrolase [Candidatus Atribacteria bacterium]|uniref:Amidohydrolase n=1 Tax=candidate division TA06 bacterium 34_109 TaxID=1635277 RepID=A0A101I219_UNCT6|nr:MAG: Amidohydrolase [candidate division TA06 bacterium 34_109]HBY57222.1 amidohydrolase [Candidatus Atribacteria bacterium]